MCRIILFAGTTEGRELAEYLSRQQVKSTVCTATEYGGQLIGNDAYRTVRAGRMDESGMRALIKEHLDAHPCREAGGVYVVDATHPYAAEVSRNIRAACEACAASYIRLLRASEEAQGERVKTVASVQEAVEFLAGTAGNILVTTGSKELEKFTALPNYEERVFARVLSSPEVAAMCDKLGFRGKHLICMQGPFSEELNTAMLRQFDAKWLVTKESGKEGGFAMKIAAAKKADAGVVLIGRPVKEEGMSPLTVRAYLMEKLKWKPRRKIAIVGIGMGSGGGMTEDARRVCKEAELLIGARRMLDGVADAPGHRFFSHRPQEIREYVEMHPEYERIVLVQSGDVGFYSGAKRLYELFSSEETEVYPGLSSLAALCAKLRTSWDDAKLLSLHGRKANLIAAVRENKKVFALLGSGEEARQILEKLADYKMDVAVTVAEQLSYPQERIRTGTPQELLKETFSDLSVLWIENPHARALSVHGIADEEFLRAKVPMTKSEVRSISLSKLRLRRDSVLYDVGAGTGSVAIEAALFAADGHVYAIEKKAEAAELIRENQKRFAADNLTVVEGVAPEALEELPEPTHVFIGGSSGNLREIIDTALRKNPAVRVVINCIALETAAEALSCVKTLPVEEIDIASVSVAKAKEVGPYHMMMGQNPVTILSFRGGKAL